MNKIVFVEDDPEVGTLIAAYLGKHDMDVVVEPRGDRAEEVIAREKPDLVLLDIMLPGKDGMSRSARAMARADCPADFARQRYEPYPLPGDGRQRLYSENHAASGTSRATASAFAPAYCSGRRRIRLLNAHAT